MPFWPSANKKERNMAVAVKDPASGYPLTSDSFPYSGIHSTLLRLSETSNSTNQVPSLYTRSTDCHQFTLSTY